MGRSEEMPKARTLSWRDTAMPTSPLGRTESSFLAMCSLSQMAQYRGAPRSRPRWHCQRQKQSISPSCKQQKSQFGFNDYSVSLGDKQQELRPCTATIKEPLRSQAIPSIMHGRSTLTFNIISFVNVLKTASSNCNTVPQRIWLLME